MRAVIQRVVSASVQVAEQEVARIGTGLLVLVGVGVGDTEEDARTLADRIVGMRIFSDTAGKFNHSVRDVGGAVLAVSQFTLQGDPWSGRRPFFGAALSPEPAKKLFDCFVEEVRRAGVQDVQTGRFGEVMAVSLLNDGPVTLIVDTAERRAQG